LNPIDKNTSCDFKRQRTIKDTLVVHFTAGGSLAGAEAQLAKPDTINVHFIMDRDGKVYRYFPEMYWAHHCGNTAISKKSISLEIVNWGGLKEKDGLWLPWTGNVNQAVPKDRIFFCLPWRGYTAFEMLTDAQEKALPEFVAYVTSKHPIVNFMTHADIVSYKTDFPPSFRQVYDAFKPKTIHMESHMSKTEPKDIQERINWLIKNRGWGDPELNYLIKIRDKG
jgi:N-acetyl-anhydromuramyl-L-alanine amidase AmpD